MGCLRFLILNFQFLMEFEGFGHQRPQLREPLLMRGELMRGGSEHAFLLRGVLAVLRSQCGQLALQHLVE